MTTPQISENPPDFRVENVNYTPEQIMAASAAMNAVLNRPLPAPGTVFYDPEEKRSLDPEGYPLIHQRSQLPQFASKLTQQTVQQLRGDIQRAVTTSTGFTPYVLESPAKFIFPVECPFAALAPRMVGDGTDIEHWKSVLSMFFYNSTNSGPFGQTNLGGTSDGATSLQGPVYNLQNYTANYQTIAQYNSVTFQSEWRSRALEGSLLARMKANLIYGLKLQEENWLINGAAKLWRPAKPLVTALTTGGSITDDTATNFWFAVSAVNGNGESLPSAVTGPIALTETEAGSFTLTFEGVINATSYNVYVANQAGAPSNSQLFIAVTGNFSNSALPVQPTDYVGSMSITATMTTVPTSGAHPLTTGTATVSQNLFDGAVSLCYLNPNTGSNPSVGEQGMTSMIIQPAATSGLLAVQDFQLLFRKMYSQARADPSHVFLSPVEAVTLDNLVGTSSNFRVIGEPNSAGAIGGLTAGTKVRKVLNQVTGTEVQVVTLPFLPQGTIMAASYAIPFPAPDIKDPPFRVMCNVDYTAVDYPPSQANPQTWGFGYFVDETLVNQYQGGWGIIEGIQPAAGV